MKIYKPTQRLVELVIVLQFDSFLKDDGKEGRLSVIDRMRINQERAKLMRGETVIYDEADLLQLLINVVLCEIKARSWQPAEAFRYAELKKKPINDIEVEDPIILKPNN